MSYDASDAAWDEFHERLAKELYPEHKAQAISEFTRERLSSFYLQYPMLLAPVLDMYVEAKIQRARKRPAATVVFFVTTLELSFKAVLLKPIVYGLVHHDSLASMIVEHALGQTGLDRYKGLLSKIFEDLTGIDVGTVQRPGASKPILEEALELQKIRNRILHQGQVPSEEEAERASEVVSTAFDQVVYPVLQALGLRLVPDSGGRVESV